MLRFFQKMKKACGMFLLQFNHPFSWANKIFDRVSMFV